MRFQWCGSTIFLIMIVSVVFVEVKLFIEYICPFFLTISGVGGFEPKFFLSGKSDNTTES